MLLIRDRVPALPGGGPSTTTVAVRPAVAKAMGKATKAGKAKSKLTK